MLRLQGMIQPPVTAAESGRSVRSFCGSLLLLLFSPRIFCFYKVVKMEARSHEESGARRTLESWRSGGNGAERSLMSGGMSLRSYKSVCPAFGVTSALKTSFFPL